MDGERDGLTDGLSDGDVAAISPHEFPQEPPQEPPHALAMNNSYGASDGEIDGLRDGLIDGDIDAEGDADAEATFGPQVSASVPNPPTPSPATCTMLPGTNPFSLRSKRTAVASASYNPSCAPLVRLIDRTSGFPVLSLDG